MGCCLKIPRYGQADSRDERIVAYRLKSCQKMETLVKGPRQYLDATLEAGRLLLGGETNRQTQGSETQSCDSGFRKSGTQYVVL